MGEQALKNIARPVRTYRVRVSEVPSGAMGTVQPSLALPDKPSIAVLPLTNTSSDHEQEFFSDGIAEDITANSYNRDRLVTSWASRRSYRDADFGSRSARKFRWAGTR
jgi:adenylate cyclase